MKMIFNRILNTMKCYFYHVTKEARLYLQAFGFEDFFMSLVMNTLPRKAGLSPVCAGPDTLFFKAE